MRKFPKLFAAACVSAAVFGAFAEKPDAEYYYPAGIQAGTTRRIVVGGQFLDGVIGGWVTGGGVEITRVVAMPNPPRALGKTQRPWLVDFLTDLESGKKEHHELPPEALTDTTDWVVCQWWTFMDLLDPLERSMIWCDMIKIFPARQYSPAISRVLIIDVTAAPDAKPGRRDIILYDENDVTVPHSFFVSAAPRVREPRYRPDFILKKFPVDDNVPKLEVPCVIDGQVFPGETDAFTLKLQKGQRILFTVTARELLPFLGDAVPGFFNPVIQLFDPNNNEIGCADDFFYLPDPVMICEIPDDGEYRLEIHDNLYRGRQDFVYIINCTPVDSLKPVFTPQERAFECFPASADQEVPKEDDHTVVRSGVLGCPGRVVRHYFTVSQPYSRYRLELFARRSGSPLDGVLKLYGPIGDLPVTAAPLLATWDESPAKLYDVKNVGSDEQPIIKTNMLYVGSVIQAERDPMGQYLFEKPGRYCVTVSDIANQGGEDYAYTLAIMPEEPSFEVYGASSSYLLNDQYETTLQLRVLRYNGFHGPIVLDDSEDIAADSYEIDDIKGTAGLAFKKKDWKGVKCIQLTASARLPNGKKKTVRITPTDPAEQAFAYSHLVPQRGFFFCVAEGDKSEDVEERTPNAKAAGGAAATDEAKREKRKMRKQKRGADHANGQACSNCHQNKRR